MAPHSNTLAWKIPWTEELGRLQSMGVARSQTRLRDFTTYIYIYKYIYIWVKQHIYMHTYCFCCLAAKSYLTLCDPMDCSPPSSSVHGIFQARILVWVAISSSRGSSWLRDQTLISCVYCIAGRFFTC